MLNRRTFLATSAVAAGAAITRRASAQSDSPNDTIGLGFIGVGWRGGQLIDAFSSLPGMRIVALSDPDEDRLQNLSRVPEKLRGKLANAERFADMRKLIEHPEVDAVVVATCNHWHCLAAVRACKAGKDVYVEKPLGHNLWEQQQLVKAARANNCMVQVGTQQRSSPIQAQIKQLLHEEKIIGKPERVVVSRVGERKPIGKRDTPLQPPASVDYDLWLGPALDQPLYRNELHYDWHWDFNTGNGEMGNWGVHVMDDALNVAFKDQLGWPSAVTSAGMRAVWDDAGNTPNIQVAQYENEVLPLTYIMSNVVPFKQLMKGADYKGFNTGYTVFCEGGRYEGTRGQGRFVDNDGKEIKKLSGGSGNRHQRGFLDAVRSRKLDDLAAEVAIGHRSTAWCHFASIAGLEGVASEAAGAAPAGWDSLYNGFKSQVKAWDSGETASGAGKITINDQTGEIAELDSDAAEQLVKREYRTAEYEKEFEV
ncbi:Gfo/Idh/MocA family protein [Aeoliella mucimassa]|uniref:Glucose--fructose oxidoreductase n=1 Tax=Aeoliella mucimassa TaxID=2527972 RepID=A0A518ASP2_9BACT|nr:Gfo/Idh/MocA family oxidoreductase [Aeoliella mucimassa]QDU57753.1 Glucose--fructose oxidoreductase precursor [Aeoliella mucimassa]